MTEFIRLPRSDRFTVPSPPAQQPAMKQLRSTKRRANGAVSTPSEPLVELADAEALEEAVQKYRFDLAGFVLDTYHWGLQDTFLEHCTGPLDWQLRELETIGKLFIENPRMVRVAIASGRGCGKTTFAAWSFTWAVSCHPEGITTAMSVTGVQAESRLWREIRKWRHVWKFANEFEIKARSLSHKEKDTWFGLIQMWNMDRLGAIRGTHEEFLAWIIDECASIPDEVFAELEAGTTGPHNFLAYFSNPTRTMGRFARCWTEDERWHCVNVDARDVPIVTPESIHEVLEDCLGDVEADRYRVEVRGLQPRHEVDAVVPMLFIERACARMEAHLEQPATTPITIGVDVASMGYNKTVFLVRQGCYIREVETYGQLEQEDVAEKLVELMERYYQYYLGAYGVLGNVKEKRQLLHKAGYAMDAFIDSDGIGVAVYEMCHRRGYPVHQVRSGSAAFEDYRYDNRRSELWLRDMRRWIRDVACLDNTASYFKTLSTELMNVYYRPVPPNKSQVERKEEMRRRGVQSPDHADALVYSFFGTPTGASTWNCWGTR